jgi:predicted transcriptional regulator
VSSLNLPSEGVGCLQDGSHLDLKKLIASSYRQKILEALSRCREMRVMQLVGRTKGAYNEVNRNLKLLEAEGIIIDDYRKQVKHGTVRVIILNRENPRTKKLLQALKLLDDEGDHEATSKVPLP